MPTGWVPRRRAPRFPRPKAGQPTLCLVKQRWVRVWQGSTSTFCQGGNARANKWFLFAPPRGEALPIARYQCLYSIELCWTRGAQCPLCTRQRPEGINRPSVQSIHLVGAAQNDSRMVRPISILFILVKECYQIITASHHGRSRWQVAQLLRTCVVEPICWQSIPVSHPIRERPLRAPRQEQRTAGMETAALK